MYDEDDSSNWESWLSKQMTAAADQAEEYGSDVVVAIFMGNENVRCPEDDDYDDMNFTPEDIVYYVQLMQEELESRGIT